MEGGGNTHCTPIRLDLAPYNSETPSLATSYAKMPFERYSITRLRAIPLCRCRCCNVVVLQTSDARSHDAVGSSQAAQEPPPTRHTARLRQLICKLWAGGRLHQKEAKSGQFVTNAMRRTCPCAAASLVFIGDVLDKQGSLLQHSRSRVFSRRDFNGNRRRPDKDARSIYKTNK